MNNQKEKTCEESCACNQAQKPKEPKEILDLTTPPKTQNAEIQNKPDPTRFGDWEIKGRAIDF